MLNRRPPSLTDVDGFLVGHCTLASRPTGCTVVTSAAPFAAGVDVRGGAPGTRETDLLRPENTVGKIHAVCLAGGSAFGLEAAAGAARYLEEKGVGYALGAVRVPVVCGAVIFDLALGDPAIRPDARNGYTAAATASLAPVAEGNVGAGAGATVGKMLGHHQAMKGGLGSWSRSCADGLQIGAIAAVNCFGDVLDPDCGKIISGARKSDGCGFFDSQAQLRRGFKPEFPMGESTVVAVVATNATLDKALCTRVAQMAQDALARCIRPSHSPADGDTVFVVASGKLPIRDNPSDIMILGALAADVLAASIVRGVREAASWGPYPAAGDGLDFDRSDGSV